MISSINLNDKDYEELIREALAQIPLYSSDWTNYNASDPGITILENLSAFAALQQSEINEVPEAVKWKLLELAGFRPRKGAPAVEYIKPVEKKTADKITADYGQKIYAQDICFELPDGGNIVAADLLGIYAVREAREGTVTENLSALAENYGIPGGVELWGAKKEQKETLYLLLDGMQEKTDASGGVEDIILYVDVKQKFARTPLGAANENPFAQISWEIWTRDGFRSVSAEDLTYCFLESGYIKIHIPYAREELAVPEEQKGYVIKASLTESSYDMAPVVSKISGPLTKVVQTDTKSKIIKTYENNYLFHHGVTEFYTMVRDGFYRKCPPSVKDTPDDDGELMAVCRSHDLPAHQKLGMLYGYDEQVIELPPFHQVYEQNFSLIVYDEEEQLYHVAFPESTQEDEVRYSVMEEENHLVIHDCGRYEGAVLYLGDYCLYRGSEGSVIAGTLFHISDGTQEERYAFPQEMKEKLTLMSFAKGEEGRYCDTFEEVRRRFTSDLNTSATMVTGKDCEELVRRIPGLSIHKIKALTDTKENKIHIVIKPNSDEEYPKLSPLYIKTVRNFLESRRMMTTRIVIEQPVYVPVNVRAVIYSKRHFEHCHEKITEALNRMLDGVHSSKDFGETISFHEVYRMLENLECVDEVCELSLSCTHSEYVKTRGLDLVFHHHALYYPGEYMLELSTG